MKFWNKDLLVVLATLSIATTAGTLLYLSLTRQSRGSQPVIGHINFKYKKAERKFMDTVVWTSLTQGSPVRNKDTIYTHEQAQATIKLVNDTELELGEKTMIYLDFAKDKILINFAHGRVRAQGRGNLMVKAGDNIVSAQGADVTLESGQSGLKMAVDQGSATLNGESVKQDETAMLQGDDLIKKKMFLVPVYPEDKSKIFTFQDKKTLSFRWQERQKKHKTIRLEVSRSPNFKILAVSRRIRRGTTMQVKLPPGVFYWRLALGPGASGKDKKQNYHGTLAQRFTIIRDRKLKLLYPPPGKTIYYLKHNSLISFSWSRSPVANDYLIQVARDQNFKNIINQKASLTPGIALSGLPDGRLYWRVRARNNIDNWPEQISPARRLTLTKRTKLQAPKLIAPKNKKKILASVVARKGIRFLWQAGTNNKIVTIAEDPKFKSIIHRQRTNRNILYINSQDIQNKIFTGTPVYWRVRSVSNTPDIKGALSPTFSFTLQQKIKIDLKTPESERVITLHQLKNRGLFFSWRVISGLSKYLLQISRDKTFADLAQQKVIAGAYHKINELKPGHYYWRVLAQGPSGQKRGLSSSIRSFAVTRSLGPPSIQTPIRQTFDLAQRPRIFFAWNKVKGADYYSFEIYRLRRDGKTLIRRKKIKSSSHTISNFYGFDVGNYRWKLQAVGLNKQGRVGAKSQAVSSSFSIIYSKVVKSPEAEVPDLFYID